MSCPHSSSPASSASTCSQCLGIVPRRVTLDRTSVILDGEQFDLGVTGTTVDDVVMIATPPRRRSLHNAYPRRKQVRR